MSRLLAGVTSPQAVRALPAEQLPALCQELREAMIDTCAKVGGHLGASLGAVELTVALHRVFKSPKDKLVFDVGHQAYAHKLLTGRADRMSTLRQEGGLAPFLDPSESPHDAFVGGHACTALSVALGQLCALRARGSEGRVVAIVGDGSLTGGLSFEGLNNAGGLRAPLVVVLNDNQMSISANVGAVPAMLAQGSGRAFFEALGFTYLGPVDGHDVSALVAAFQEARRSALPVVVHCRTQKGKGFGPAEEDERTRGHAMGPYAFRDGKLVRATGIHQTYSEGFAEALREAMHQDARVVAVTPAMLEGSALAELKEELPSRVFDVGIAEQHAVAFAAGLASQGLRPVCCIYSTFLQRAIDQVVHDVALPGLPVVFAVDRAGLVGADGATHQGAYDLALLRPLPGLSLLAPVTGGDLAPMLSWALKQPGPTAIRFPRASLPSPVPEVPRLDGEVVSARWLKFVARPSVVLLTAGPVGLSALEAARGEASWGVLDVCALSPLDEAPLLEAARCGRVVTAEEAAPEGGLFSAFVELCAREGVSPRVSRLSMPRAFVRHGDARAQREAFGLSVAGLARAARELLSRDT
jgi:1-deoxy-D-xylulose-5-phosphate synthase